MDNWIVTDPRAGERSTEDWHGARPGRGGNGITQMVEWTIKLESECFSIRLSIRATEY